jgi:glycerol-3-phosphate O-acyltransferase
MSSDRQSALFRPRAREVVLRELTGRSRARMQGLNDDELSAMLEDALYQERKRLEKQTAKPGETEHLDELAHALVRGRREDWMKSGLDLVHGWSDEIHGVFNPRVYGFATRVLPRAIAGLLSSRPKRLRDWNMDSETRVRVDGDLEFLRELSKESVLVLAPTHVSNLDSPLIGLALYLAGLPPFVYGAGLNLFSNKVVGWWMARLGAYTVDRTKRAALYKEVLKDYSVQAMVTGHHSLFFPGGTRSRSGCIEQRLKKGLLGTGVVAWQEMLRAGRPNPDVYVVPLTLTFQLVLEASTLIGDYLADAGKQRFIISDDEFSRARDLASFSRRVLDLDDSVVARFGQPLDLLGYPVPRDKAERAAASQRRRRYVTGPSGEVEADSQRDRVYTDRLAKSLGRAYPRDITVMSTHLAAWALWRCLEDSVGSKDVFRLLRVPMGKRKFPRHEVEARIGSLQGELSKLQDDGRLHVELPSRPAGILSQAIDRFTRYHSGRAVASAGSFITMEDSKLCFYYRNRLTLAGLES